MSGTGESRGPASGSRRSTAAQAAAVAAWSTVLQTSPDGLGFYPLVSVTYNPVSGNGGSRPTSSSGSQR